MQQDKKEDKLQSSERVVKKCTINAKAITGILNRSEPTGLSATAVAQIIELTTLTIAVLLLTAR